MLKTHEPVRLGIVGLGLIAQTVHLQNLRDLPDRFRLTHLCDLSPRLTDEIGQEWGGEGRGVRTTSDSEALLADENVDAVLILTPGTHSYLARRALERGKHVLAEKPFSHTVAEALSLAALARSRDLVLQVAYMKMFDPIMVRARAELPGIGTPRLVRVSVLHPADDPQFAHQRYRRFDDADPGAGAAERRFEQEQLRAALGEPGEPFVSLFRDVLQGSTVHEMAVLRALLGDRDLRIAHAQIGPFEPGRALSEPPQLQVLGTLGELQLSLSWNWLPEFPDYAEEVAVLGSGGQLSVRFPGPYLRDHRSELHVRRPCGQERSTSCIVSEHRTGFVHELLAFHACLAECAPLLSDAAGSARDTAALQDIVHALAASHGVALGGEAASRSAT